MFYDPPCLYWPVLLMMAVVMHRWYAQSSSTPPRGHQHPAVHSPCAHAPNCSWTCLLQGSDPLLLMTSRRYSPCWRPYVCTHDATSPSSTDHSVTLAVRSPCTRRPSSTRCPHLPINGGQDLDLMLGILWSYINWPQFTHNSLLSSSSMNSTATKSSA